MLHNHETQWNNLTHLVEKRKRSDINRQPSYKGTVHPRTGIEGPKVEKGYSYTLSLTLAIAGVDGQRHAPAVYPLERSGTHCIRGWVGPRTGLDGCGKSRPSPGFDPRTVQPVASRYTDRAIAAHRQPSYCFDKQEISTFCSSANARLHLPEAFRCLEHKNVFFFRWE
jgi:hypothetical protein